MQVSTHAQGYWEVGNQKFINKVEALSYSKKTNEHVNFKYFDDIFDKVNITNLGQKPLDTLYKERAIQLREQYDYLILYFSGGADSYNILRTFLDNSIQLDEVCVKWCNQTKNSNNIIYNPNTEDDSCFNYLSEFDFAIKPVLENLSNKCSNIKITIVDWLPNVENTINESLFTLVNNWHDIELPMMVTYSPSEIKQTNLGKKVGSIYGIDKPRIIYHQENAYMYFVDGSTTMGVPNPENPYGIEYFYWTPNMPNLAFEMAYKFIMWELQNPFFYSNYAMTDELRNNFKLKPPKLNIFEIHQVREAASRDILYTNWDKKFQAKKPLFLDRTDKQNWILKYDQLKPYCESFYSQMSNIAKECNLNYLLFSPTSNRIGYKLIPTKKFLVLKSYKKYLKNDNQTSF